MIGVYCLKSVLGIRNTCVRPFDWSNFRKMEPRTGSKTIFGCIFKIICWCMDPGILVYSILLRLLIRKTVSHRTLL